MWLEARPETPKVSSHLAWIDVARACRRINPDVMGAASELLAGVDAVPMDAAIVGKASSVGGLALRGPDAIHLASALSLGGELSALVSYDHRLVAAAKAEGCPVVTPSGRTQSP